MRAVRVWKGNSIDARLRGSATVFGQRTRTDFRGGAEPSGAARLRLETEDVRLLMQLMLETGMRIGNAVDYDPSRVRRKGMPKRYDVFLKPELKEAIDNCFSVIAQRPNVGSAALRRYFAYTPLPGPACDINVRDCAQRSGFRVVRRSPERAFAAQN